MKLLDVGDINRLDIASSGLALAGLNGARDLFGLTSTADDYTMFVSPYTYVGSKWYLTSETATTISAINTPVKIAGTTTGTINEWFEHTSSNRVTYLGGQNIAVKTECRFSFTGTNGDQIKLSLWRWDDSASGFVMVGNKSPAITMNAAGRAENIAYDIVDDISTDDYYEVRVENISAARNVTLLQDSSFFVTERAS